MRHFGVVNAGKPYNGAAVVLDPRSGEVLSLVSLPAYDPNKFAVGLDAATWKSLITDKAKPLSNRALQSTYSPGSTFKLVVATAAMEEGVVNARLPRPLPAAARPSTDGGSSATSRADTAAWTCATRSRSPATSTSTRSGNMLGVDRIHKWAIGARAGPDQRHRSAERAARARSVDGMEAAREEGEVVRRRNDLGRDRPGAGQRHAAVAGGDDDDARQRRHALHAARAEGDRQGQGLGAVRAAAAALGRAR